MPPLSTRSLNQTAVLWAFSGYGADGEPTVTDPVEVPVRWERIITNRQEPRRNANRYDALVAVDREIAEGSRMWLGTLSDWLGTGSAGADDEVMVVTRYRQSPSIRGDDIRREVDLLRFKDIKE